MFAIQRFEKVSDVEPDRIAVVDGEKTVSYGALEARSNRLAHHFMNLGAGPHSIICTHLPPGLNLMIAILAIAKTGGAFLAIDPQIPIARKQRMLAECEPHIIINSETAKWIRGGDASVVDLVGDSHRIDAESDARPKSKIIEGSLAYLFYTSGSTGDPKAVMVPWRKQAPPQDTAPYPGAHDRHVLKSSPAFTLIVREIFQPVTSGGRVYLFPDGQNRDPDKLLDIILVNEITLISVVPSVLRVMLSNPKLTRCRSLRFIDCIGEALSPELRTTFQEKLPVPLGVTYGCTEASSATSRIFKPGDSCDRVDLGKPLANHLVHILDRNYKQVKKGEPGRIFLGGELSIGYFKSPRLTAQRFLPDPYSKLPGARMYKTGDQGKFSSKGSLIYMGRSDDQIQIRGQRVEPTEIEKVVSEHDAVEQAVVLPQPNSQQSYLVAFVVTRAKGLTEVGLREHARSRLPEYMVPARFMLVDELPLLPSGKIDRTALTCLRPKESIPSLPRNSIEQALVDIWLDLLDVEEVGIHDDFFTLGGQSLTATQVVSRIRDQLNVDLPLQFLFDRPTIAELAEVINQLHISP